MSRLKPKNQKNQQDQMNGMDTSGNAGEDPMEDNIIETPIEDLPPVGPAEEIISDESDGSTPIVNAEPITITTTVEDCETIYGVVLETAHGMFGTKNGKGHRELPEERRKAQGRLLHSICEKYGIEIPTELELVIFGGSLIADWSYMGAVAKEQEMDGIDRDVTSTD